MPVRMLLSRREFENKTKAAETRSGWIQPLCGDRAIDANGWDAGQEGKDPSSKFMTWVTGRSAVPFTALGKPAERAGLWRGTREFAWDTLSLGILGAMSPNGYKIWERRGKSELQLQLWEARVPRWSRMR